MTNTKLHTPPNFARAFQKPLNLIRDLGVSNKKKTNVGHIFGTSCIRRNLLVSLGKSMNIALSDNVCGDCRQLITNVQLLTALSMRVMAFDLCGLL